MITFSTRVEARKEKKEGNHCHLDDSEDDSTEEKNEKKVTNICFMAIDELDKINSNLGYDDLQDALKNYMRILKKLV